MSPLPKILALGFVLILNLLYFIAPASAEWSSYRGTSTHQGSVSYVVGELSPIRWTSENISTVTSPPIVNSTGDIYVATTNGLTKINSSGQKIWTLSSISNPSASPAIDNNGNLYFATSGCNPYVYSVTSGGSLRWQYDLRQGGGQCSHNQSNSAVSFSTDKQTLYVGVDYPSEKLMAFDLNGGVVWQTNLNEQYPGGSSAAVAGDGLIYVGSGGNGRLFSLTSGGSIRWYHTVASGPTVRLKTPIVDVDGNVYITTQGATGGEYLSSYNSSGSRRWFYQITGSTFSGDSALKDNVIYIVEGNRMRAINTETGTLTWQWTSPTSGNLTTPVVDSRRVIYTSSDSTIYAVNSTGTTKSTFSVAAGLGAPIISGDGLIYVYRNQSSSSNGWLYALGQAHEVSYPVIFIPGIGGSEFQATQDIIWSKDDGHGGVYSHAYPSGEKVWVNESEAAALGDDDYFDVLRLKTDGETPEADLSLTGNLTPLGYPEIDDFFEDLGYTKGTNYFVFPYDWRKDIRTTKDSLDSLIEEAKTESGMPKVNIVAHSMGGLVAHNYIADATKAAKVGKFIKLGVPHLGSTKTAKALLYGTPLGKPILKFFNIGLPSSEVKDIGKNMTGLYELIPLSEYFSFYDNSDEEHLYPYADDRDIDNDGVVGPLNFNQMKNLFTNLTYNTTAFSLAEQYHSDLAANLNSGNGVRLYSIVGSGEPTLGQIREGWWISWPIQLFPRYEEIYINGDETVPLYSASLKSSTRDLSAGATIYYVEQKHENLVNRAGYAMQVVQNILNEGDTLPVQVKDEKIILEGHHISVDQNTVLDLYDEGSNHTGLDTNNKVETNIPNTSFDVLENTKHAFIKKSSPRVRARVSSSQTKKAKIKIRQYANDRISKTIFYKDVPVTASTPIEFQIEPSTSTSPQLTAGTQTISPTSEAVGGAVYDSTPPTTTVTLSGTKDSSGNYSGNVTVTITSSDSSAGILETEYSLDNGQTALTYTSPFTVSTSGSNTLKVRAIDKVGNEELPQTISFNILSSTSSQSSGSQTSSSGNSSVQNSTGGSTILDAIFGNKQDLNDNPQEPGDNAESGEVLGVQLNNTIRPSVKTQLAFVPPFWLTLIPVFTILLTPFSIETALTFLKRVPFKNPISQKMNNPKPKKNIN